MTELQNGPRAADLMLAAARIDAEVASRPGDPLYEGDKQHAQKLRDAVNSPPPVYMQEVGAGGELVPASTLGENSRALDLRDTVNDPNYVTVDASRDRLELANQAGCLEEALDAAETIEAQNSLERMLAHQLAASHRSSMKMTEQMNACLGRMRHGYAEERERACVQATRLAGAIARMNGSYQSGVLTLQKLRTGGRQTVVVQHVNVNDGGQALVAGEVQAGVSGTGSEGKRPKHGQ